MKNKVNEPYQHDAKITEVKIGNLRYWISTKDCELYIVNKECFGSAQPVPGDWLSATLSETGLPISLKHNGHLIYENTNYISLHPILKKQVNDARRAHSTDTNYFNEKEIMFICVEGMKIANAVKTVGALKEFATKTADEKQQQIPELSAKHSAETLKLSCSAAMAVIQGKQKEMARLHQMSNAGRA